jgi:hypothetical protein
LEATQVISNGKKESGTLDTSKLVGTVIGVKTFVRPADDARGFDESARVRRMFAADTVSTNGDTDVEDLDEEEGDYSEMDLAELKAELKERGLSTKGKKPQLIARLEEADEEDEEEEESDDTEEEGEEEEYAWEDIAELTKAELKDLITEEELDIKVSKKADVEDIRQKVADALEIEVPEDEEEDEEDSDDYDEWDVDDLKEELEQRSLSVKGSKKLLVSRLRKDDAEEDKPF